MSDLLSNPAVDLYNHWILIWVILFNHLYWSHVSCDWALLVWYYFWFKWKYLSQRLKEWSGVSCGIPEFAVESAVETVLFFSHEDTIAVTVIDVCEKCECILCLTLRASVLKLQWSPWLMCKSKTNKQTNTQKNNFVFGYRAKKIRRR